MLPLSPKPWSELTFGCADLGDTRRTKRLVKVAVELSAHTGNSLSSSCEGYTALVTGAYRLIENEAVKPAAIADAGFQATAKIARQSRLLLALEDTTTLDYKHAVRSELGDIGGPEGSKPEGFTSILSSWLMRIQSEALNCLIKNDSNSRCLLTTLCSKAYRRIIKYTIADFICYHRLSS